MGCRRERDCSCVSLRVCLREWGLRFSCLYVEVGRCVRVGGLGGFLSGVSGLQATLEAPRGLGVLGASAGRLRGLLVRDAGAGAVRWRGVLARGVGARRWRGVFGAGCWRGAGGMLAPERLRPSSSACAADARKHSWPVPSSCRMMLGAPLCLCRRCGGGDCVHALQGRLQGPNSEGLWQGRGTTGGVVEAAPAVCRMRTRVSRGTVVGGWEANCPFAWGPMQSHSPTSPYAACCGTRGRRL